MIPLQPQYEVAGQETEHLREANNVSGNRILAAAHMHGAIQRTLSPALGYICW